MITTQKNAKKWRKKCIRDRTCLRFPGPFPPQYTRSRGKLPIRNTRKFSDMPACLKSASSARAGLSRGGNKNGELRNMREMVKQMPKLPYRLHQRLQEQLDGVRNDLAEEEEEEREEEERRKRGCVLFHCDHTTSGWDQPHTDGAQPEARYCGGCNTKPTPHNPMVTSFFFRLSHDHDVPSPGDNSARAR